MQPTMDQTVNPQPQNRRWSLKDASQREQLLNTHLSNAQDILTWDLSTAGVYSAKSCYETLVKVGKTEWHLAYTWRLKIPPTVQLFAFLFLKGTILTHDVEKGHILWSHANSAVLKQPGISSFIVNMQPAARAGCRILYIGQDTQSTFTRSWTRCKSKMTRKKWGAIFLAGCWHLWLERNQRIFHGKSKGAELVADRAMQEARVLRCMP